MPSKTRVSPSRSSNERSASQTQTSKLSELEPKPVAQIAPLEEQGARKPARKMRKESPQRQHTLVICDPEEEFLSWAAKSLRADDLEILATRSSEEALELVEKREVSLLLANAEAQPLSGEKLLKRTKLTRPQALVILWSNFPPSGAVIRSMAIGAHDFVRKGSLALDLRRLVEQALQVLEGHAAEPKEGDEAGADEVLIARSPAMQEVAKLIGRVARSQATVLVTGESGSGKEIVAKAIHEHSPRSEQDFVAINCAAIPETLLESELFGHEKGSFTGAHARRIGRFEQASSGTLFLDEIGDMPLGVQAKLLRVLQEGQFSRVGGNEPIETGVRILAATHRDLEEAIAEGTFREDLYYRLNVVRLHLPPLRERAADVRPLADLFLRRLSSHHGLPPVTISSEGMKVLEAYHWPGNVRELENTLHRAAILANREVLLPSDLPLGEIYAGKPKHKEIQRQARQLLAALESSGSDDAVGGAIELIQKLGKLKG